MNAARRGREVIARTSFSDIKHDCSLPYMSCIGEDWYEVSIVTKFPAQQMVKIFDVVEFEN